MSKRKGNKMKLSKRQNEVKDLLLQGYTNAEIANSLGLTVHTVKTHVCNIYLKTGVSSRMELAWHEICTLRNEI